MAISDYDSTAGNNTSISGINIAEGCAPGNINNAIRQMMADLATEYTYKPSFEATQTSDQTITADAWAAMQIDNEVFDNGATYNNSTYTFTAPVAGIYSFTVGALYRLVTTVPVAMRIGIGVNGSDPTNYRRIIWPSAALVHLKSQPSATFHVSLSATNTVRPMVFFETNNAQIGGTNTSFFSGARIK